jgi:hypothetical protein
MGTWGTGTFEDDDALDWAWELEEFPDLGVVQAALEAIDRSSAYLEAPDCTSALAAAEVVAALCGQPAEGLPEGVSAWVAAHSTLPPAALKPLALRVVQRILERSELRDLWRESDGFAAWSSHVQGVARRVA